MAGSRLDRYDNVYAQRAETAVARANNLLRVIRAANEALVRSDAEPVLTTRSCGALVEVGHFRAASIAMVSSNGAIGLQAFAGEQIEALRAMETRWIAQGAEGGHLSAIRAAHVQLHQNWTREPPRSVG